MKFCQICNIPDDWATIMYLQVNGVVDPYTEEKTSIHYRVWCCEHCVHKGEQLSQWRKNAVIASTVGPGGLVLLGFMVSSNNESEILFMITLSVMILFGLAIFYMLKRYFNRKEPEKTNAFLGLKLSYILMQHCRIQKWSNSCWVKLLPRLKPGVEVDYTEIPAIQRQVQDDDYYLHKDQQ